MFLRNGLKCVTACGNCRGEGCNNAEEICLDDAKPRDDIYEELEHFLDEVLVHKLNLGHPPHARTNTFLCK